MDRYDSIEYDFAAPNPEQITVTDKDGFITSQQYLSRDDILPSETFADSEENIENEENLIKIKPFPKETVLKIRLTICIILAAAAFVVKTIGGETYQKVKKYYNDNLNNSIIVKIDRNANSDFVSQVKNNDAVK